MNNCLPYCLSLLVLLCMVSTGIVAKNTTSNHTEPEEHHSYSEEKIEGFFKKYGDGNGNIIASQLCNFTQKLSGCNAKASSDGHDHGSETTQEHLVEGTNESEEEHHEEEEEGHDEDEDGHEEGHEEEGHEEEEKVRVFILYVGALPISFSEYKL